MSLDFTPLTMSELRNRPGEILDRVASDGESFLIERNGHQRACLVPISVFLPDVSPARIARELDALEKAGEVAKTTINDNREITICVRDEQHPSYTIAITLPHNYPNICPRVYIAAVANDAPHRFADGSLCIFGAMSSWNPGKHTVLDALENARYWLAHYRSWRTTGRWSDGGISDER